MNAIHELRYGKPTRAQAETFVVMAGQAFAFDPSQWLSSLNDDGWGDMRALTDGEQLAAGLVIHTTGQWFGGRRLASHALSAVVAAPQARRKKLGHTLMLHALREARADNVPLCVLYASTPAFYRGQGFEPAGEQMFWRTATHHLPTETEDARYVPCGPEDPGPRELYRQFASERSGLVDRNAHFWRAHLSPYDGAKRYLYRVEFAGALEGYVSLQHARPQNTLFVQDAITTSTRAARAALALISHHKSVAE